MNQQTVGMVVASLGLLCAVLSLAVAVILSPLEGTLLSVFFAGVCALVYCRIARPILQDRALQKTGIPAEAVVLEARDTGTTVNRNPKVELLLEIRPSEDTPFQMKTAHVVSRLQAPLLQPGTVVEVRYDPRDRRRISLAAVSSSAAGGRKGPAERLVDLDDLRRRGLITDAEYHQKRAEILRNL